MRSDVATRKANLMTDISVLLQLAVFGLLLASTNGAGNEVAGLVSGSRAVCLEMTVSIHTINSVAGLCGSTQSRRSAEGTTDDSDPSKYAHYTLGRFYMCASPQTEMFTWFMLAVPGNLL